MEVWIRPRKGRPPDHSGDELDLQILVWLIFTRQLYSFTVLHSGLLFSNGWLPKQLQLSEASGQILTVFINDLFNASAAEPLVLVNSLSLVCQSRTHRPTIAYSSYRAGPVWTRSENASVSL